MCHHVPSNQWPRYPDVLGRQPDSSNVGEDFSLPRKPSISNDKLVKYCRNGGFPNQLYLCIFTDFLLFSYHVWLLCWYSNPAAVVFIWSNFAGAWWGLFRSVKRKNTWREHWPSRRPPCFQEAYIVRGKPQNHGNPLRLVHLNVSCHEVQWKKEPFV